jgi:hypothetical protein
VRLPRESVDALRDGRLIADLLDRQLHPQHGRKRVAVAARGGSSSTAYDGRGAMELVEPSDANAFSRFEHWQRVAELFCELTGFEIAPDRKELMMCGDDAEIFALLRQLRLFVTGGGVSAVAPQPLAVVRRPHDDARRRSKSMSLSADAPPGITGRLQGITGLHPQRGSPQSKNQRRLAPMGNDRTPRSSNATPIYQRAHDQSRQPQGNTPTAMGASRQPRQQQPMLMDSTQRGVRDAAQHRSASSGAAPTMLLYYDNRRSSAGPAGSRRLPPMISPTRQQSGAASPGASGILMQQHQQPQYQQQQQQQQHRYAMPQHDMAYAAPGAISSPQLYFYAPQQHGAGASVGAGGHGHSVGVGAGDDGAPWPVLMRDFGTCVDDDPGEAEAPAGAPRASQRELNRAARLFSNRYYFLSRGQALSRRALAADGATLLRGQCRRCLPIVASLRQFLVAHPAVLRYELKGYFRVACTRCRTLMESLERWRPQAEPLTPVVLTPRAATPVYELTEGPPAGQTPREATPVYVEPPARDAVAAMLQSILMARSANHLVSHLWESQLQKEVELKNRPCASIRAAACALLFLLRAARAAAVRPRLVANDRGFRVPATVGEELFGAGKRPLCERCSMLLASAYRAMQRHWKQDGVAVVKPHAFRLMCDACRGAVKDSRGRLERRLWRQRAFVQMRVAGKVLIATYRLFFKWKRRRPTASGTDCLRCFPISEALSERLRHRLFPLPPSILLAHSQRLSLEHHIYVVSADMAAALNRFAVLRRWQLRDYFEAMCRACQRKLLLRTSAALPSPPPLMKSFLRMDFTHRALNFFVRIAVLRVARWRYRGLYATGKRKRAEAAQRKAIDSCERCFPIVAALIQRIRRIADVTLLTDRLLDAYAEICCAECRKAVIYNRSHRGCLLLMQRQRRQVRAKAFVALRLVGIIHRIREQRHPSAPRYSPLQLPAAKCAAADGKRCQPIIDQLQVHLSYSFASETGTFPHGTLGRFGQATTFADYDHIALRYVPNYFGVMCALCRGEQRSHHGRETLPQFHEAHEGVIRCKAKFLRGVFRRRARAHPATTDECARCAPIHRSLHLRIRRMAADALPEHKMAAYMKWLCPSCRETELAAVTLRFRNRKLMLTVQRAFRYHALRRRCHEIAVGRERERLERPLLLLAHRLQKGNCIFERFVTDCKAPATAPPCARCTPIVDRFVVHVSALHGEVTDAVVAPFDHVLCQACRRQGWLVPQMEAWSKLLFRGRRVASCAPVLQYISLLVHVTLFAQERIRWIKRHRAFRIRQKRFPPPPGNLVSKHVFGCVRCQPIVTEMQGRVLQFYGAAVGEEDVWAAQYGRVLCEAQCRPRCARFAKSTIRFRRLAIFVVARWRWSMLRPAVAAAAAEEAAALGEGVVGTCERCVPVRVMEARHLGREGVHGDAAATTAVKARYYNLSCALCRAS